LNHFTDPAMIKKMFTRAGGEIIEALPEAAAETAPLEIQQ
jgi:hypothetical protein